MRIHFIAIGGAAMHSLAIALQKKGHTVTGSDDEIFDPARSALERAGILPEAPGWYPERISSGLDAVILGMHARKDNPELKKALEQGIRVFSFPEFLYHETQDKLRVVIAGSHGKTTITSMVMHVLRYHKVGFDYMVGSRLEGFDNMVDLDGRNKLAVFEGDEYLSSCLDPRPKFLLYKPDIALISGIAWDHINVFPTFENYKEQFRLLIESLPDNGSLVYCEEDDDLKKIVMEADPNTDRPDPKRPNTRRSNTNRSNAKGQHITKIPYTVHDHNVTPEGTFLRHAGKSIEVRVFGRHNMQNLSGAMEVCRLLGISQEQFYEAITSFQGSARRLELLAKKGSTTIFTDFAHSPSKVEATVKAVRERYPERKLLGCLELHTFSSLNKAFLKHYGHTMEAADEAVVFFNPDTLRHKKLEMITEDEVRQSFDHRNLKVITDMKELEGYLLSQSWQNTTLLLMSSGNFAGLDLKTLSQQMLS